METEYRIAGNGYEYRIEYKSITSATGTGNWIPAEDNAYLSRFYSTLEEAQKALYEVKKKNARYTGDWVPVPKLI